MKIAVVLGTRPEIIKMAPVIRALVEKAADYFILHTGQHYSYDLDKVFFEQLQLPPARYNLEVGSGSHAEQTAKILMAVEKVLPEEAPDIVMVEGDTNSVLAGALAAAKLQIKVGHVEAGLRTYRKYSPFPEEINRKITTAIADLHFAPTRVARDTLLAEGIRRDRVFVVGNPVIDALLHVAGKDYPFRNRALARIDFGEKRVIAVTAHRRESHGKPFVGMMRALRQIAGKYDDVLIVFPVHPNPNVRKPVQKILKGARRVLLVDPLDYKEFVKLLKSSYLIITDSGGIQEEAPSLKKPVLLMREVTERPEAVKAGAVKVVGTDTDRIVKACSRLLDSRQAYGSMIVRRNPYGDGTTSERIVKIVRDRLGRIERA